MAAPIICSPPEVDSVNYLDLSISDVDFHHLDVMTDIGRFKLRDAYEHFALNQPGEIPFVVKLFENPASPLALPGKVTLFGHDCIHLLLNCGKSANDEAFVIGFTMGNSDSLKPHHIGIFQVVSAYLYPQKYRFNSENMQVFKLGLEYGKSLSSRNINHFNFTLYEDMSIQCLRSTLGIDLERIREQYGTEKL